MAIFMRSVLATLIALFVTSVVRGAHLEVLERNVDSVAGFLHVYGAIYGTVLAFVIFVVWGQFNGAEAGVSREARALAEMLTLCRSERGSGFKVVRAALQHYASVASEDEWVRLGQGKPCPAADEAFLELQDAVLDLEGEGEREVQRRELLLKVAERASELRAERLAVSNTRIPPTLWRTLVLATVVLSFAVSLLGATSAGLAAFQTGSITLVITLILGVVEDMDNPFLGVYCASRAPLSALRVG